MSTEQDKKQELPTAWPERVYVWMQRGGFTAHATTVRMDVVDGMEVREYVPAGMHTGCQCDHCQGVNWPAPIGAPEEELRKLEGIVRMVGQSIAEHADQIAAKAIGMKEGGR